MDSKTAGAWDLTGELITHAKGLLKLAQDAWPDKNDWTDAEFAHVHALLTNFEYEINRKIQAGFEKERK